MDIYEFVFIIQLLAFIGILLAKLYNVFSLGQWYDMKISFILFISAVMAFGVGLVISALGYEELLYLTLFTIEGWLLGLHAMLLLTEIFMHWYNTATKRVQAYNAIKAYGIKMRR